MDNYDDLLGIDNNAEDVFQNLSQKINKKDNNLKTARKPKRWFGNYISFRRMITLVIIQILHFIGMIVITIGGFYFLFNGNGDDSFVMGLVILILGNLAWRMVCELLILLFRLVNSVSKIENGINLLNYNFAKSFNISQEIIEKPTQAQAQMPKKDNAIRYCVKCGAKITDPNIKFCLNCGEKL